MAGEFYPVGGMFAKENKHKSLCLFALVFESDGYCTIVGLRLNFKKAKYYLPIEKVYSSNIGVGRNTSW